MITLLSGGTGAPKLLQGLLQVVEESEIAVIVNTAEDKWLSHGYFSPDIDTVVYTLAGVIDESCWHGIKGDTFHTHERLVELGFGEFLRIGDRDRATHIWRGAMMREGHPLSEVVTEFSRRLGISTRVLPMSDDPVETGILTSEGTMDLHEYLIKNRCEPEVDDIRFAGIEEAGALPEALDCIRNSEKVIIGPSNPVTSISPILGVRGIREALQEKRKDTVAISPFISGRPVSGPADRFMEAWGLNPGIEGMAELYQDIASIMVMDAGEEEPRTMESIRFEKTDILMRTDEDKRGLAQFVLGLD